MNKQRIVEKIVARLAAELELYAQSARAAHADATHEQSKAENKYDTRGLEASYLARGQSRKTAEIEEARQLFESLELRAFGPGTPIDVGALVELEAVPATGEAERAFYFIGPRAGGTEIVHAGKNILVITPESPLGREMVGKRLGDALSLSLGRSRLDYRVASVW